VAHEVGKAKQDEERWKLFEQLHNAIEELKRRQKRKKTPGPCPPSPPPPVPHFASSEHLFPTEEEFEQLRVWLLKNGLEQRWLENIEFAANLPEGCGVVAKKDFQKDEPFLQVSSSCCLSPATDASWMEDTHSPHCVLTLPGA